MKVSVRSNISTKLAGRDFLDKLSYMYYEFNFKHCEEITNYIVGNVSSFVLGFTAY